MVLKTKGRELRHCIIEAANRLFYRQGFNQTSFSDIATEAQVPRGNFYYYFRSKDELLEAVVDYRLEGIRAMLQEWDREIPFPRDRLKRYVQILANEEQDILRYGCPMGSLNMELGKTQLQLKSHAREMFEVFRDWLMQQFVALGYEPQAQEFALHLLAAAQGASLLGNAFEDAGMLHSETRRLQDWIDQL